MHTDPIADLLTRIRNAAKAHHTVVAIPHSKVKEAVLKILKSNSFINDYETEQDGKFKNLIIELNEERGRIDLKRISKPGQRIYVKRDDLKQIKSGLGFSIISTSKGLMTNREARKANLGGEIICEVS
jgi:small subunit ribosomal protein S8